MVRAEYILSPESSIMIQESGLRGADVGGAVIQYSARSIPWSTEVHRAWANNGLSPDCILFKECHTYVDIHGGWTVSPCIQHYYYKVIIVSPFSI